VKPVRLFKPDVRLSKLISEPGGATIASSLARAEQRLEAVRERAIADIDGMIAEIAARAKDADERTRKVVYALADQVFAFAGTLKLAELSAAAHSLCLLLVREAPPPTQREIDLHVSTFRALRRPELSGNKTARAAVLDGLRRMAAAAER